MERREILQQYRARLAAELRELDATIAAMGREAAPGGRSATQQP
jgi:hypothetical protein